MTQWLDDLLLWAHRVSASGLVLREAYAPMVIIDGHTLSSETSAQPPGAILRDFATRLAQDRHPSGQPFGLGWTFGGHLRARIQISRASDGYTLTARLIDEHIRTLDSLQLSPRNIEHLARIRRGLVLICGDIGHGKTTLWRSLVWNLVQQRALRVSTIEDPVEFLFKHPLVQQHEVGGANTYATYIKHWLRSDVQVGVIGEIRDRKTARYALQAAESGVLVIATMHTERSVDAPDRLAGFFGATDSPLARTQLSYALSMILSPRLVPIISGGRRMILESFPVDHNIRAIIRAGDTKALNDVLRSGGMHSGTPMQAWTVEDALRSLRAELDPAVILEYANEPDLCKEER